MGKCVKLQRTITKVCTGSLNKRIKIYTRALTPPVNPYEDAVDYTEEFTLVASLWAMLKVNRGVTYFDGVNTASVTTSDFYIRYRTDITAENWIIYNNNRYDIIEVSDYDEMYLMLRTRQTADENKAVGEA